jgi:diacylglycerol O-acyltransferase
MSRIILNNVDLAWLRLDKPNNPMMITVVIQFKGQIDYDLFVTSIKDMVRRYRRFRQRIVRPHRVFSRPYWEDDPDSRVEDHIERVELPLPADDAALEKFSNKKLNTLMDYAHPLWRISLIDNHPNGSIMIATVHHCIADGISLLQVLLTLTQPSPEGLVKQALADDPNRVEPQNNLGSEDPQVKPQTFSPVSQVNLGRSTLNRKPNIADMITAILRIVFRPPDPPTIFKGQLGPIKKAVWSDDFNLSEIKQIAEIKGATINDVLMAIEAGALRRYMDLHNNNRRENIRAFIMVNLRGNSFDEDLGNKFGLVFLTLPIDREMHLERLEVIKNGMDILKSSAEYAATYLILNILGLMPTWVETLAARFLDTKGTIVATNVPGPRHTLYMAGATISSIKAWVPQTGRIGVGFSFISYNGRLGVGVNADVGVIPDPESLLQLFSEEYKSFKEVLLPTQTPDASTSDQV